MQNLFLARFQPCEHAYFLEHFRAEIVRVIDDQHDLFALHELLQQESVEHVEQLHFLRFERIEPEIHEHRLQKLDFVKLRLEYLRNDHVLIELRQELLDKGGLAAADFSRDHHEAFAIPHAVVHVSLGAGVSLAHEEKPGVRRELEWLYLQTEMLEIHVRLPSGCRTVLWSGTIAQKQHDASVQETLRGNIALAPHEPALDRGGQAASESVSCAQDAGAFRVPFVQTRECALQIIRRGVDAHHIGLDPGQDKASTRFVVVLVHGVEVVDAARVSQHVVSDVSALLNVDEFAALVAIHGYNEIGRAHV